MGAALAALVAMSFGERWEVLAGSPFPRGVDGYFYPIQLRALIETGELAYPAAPLALWLMAPLAALTDPIMGAKLGAAILGALIALPTYAVGARLGGRGAGLLAAALATRSAGSAYLSIEFVKNGVGLVAALAALWLVLRALETPTRGRIGGAVVGIAAAALAHKMAAGIVAALGVPAVIAALAARGALRGRRLLYAIGAIGAVALAALAAGLAAPESFLSPRDAALARDLWTSDARWTAPALARGITLGYEALTGAVLAALVIAAGTRAGRQAIGRATAAFAPRLATAGAPRPRAADAAIVGGLAALALAIGLPWLDVTDPQGLGFRLRVAAFVPMALLAATLAARLLAHVRYRGAALAAVAAASLLHTPGDREEGLVATHPALVASVQAMATALPPGATVIVPERHIMYMVAWYLRAEVALRPDGVPPERRWRALPLAWIERGSALDRALLAARGQPEPPIGVHPLHPNGMVLVPEATWGRIAAALPAGARWPAWPTR